MQERIKMDGAWKSISSDKENLFQRWIWTRTVSFILFFTMGNEIDNILKIICQRRR